MTLLSVKFSKWNRPYPEEPLAIKKLARCGAELSRDIPKAEKAISWLGVDGWPVDICASYEKSI